MSDIKPVIPDHVMSSLATIYAIKKGWANETEIANALFGVALMLVAKESGGETARSWADEMLGVVDHMLNERSRLGTWKDD